MPGLVKANPVFCGFWLLLCVGFGVVFTTGHLSKMSGVLLGADAGVTVWWAIMLCFSRGWIKEGD